MSDSVLRGAQALSAFDLAAMREGDLVAIFGRPPRVMYAHDVEYPQAWQHVQITGVWRLSDTGDYVRLWPPRETEIWDATPCRECGGAKSAPHYYHAFTATETKND